MNDVPDNNQKVETPKKGFFSACQPIFVLFLLLCVIAVMEYVHPSWFGSGLTTEDLERSTTLNVHGVWYDLEGYYSEHDNCYPRSIEILYTGKDYTRHLNSFTHEPRENVKFTTPVKAGNFTYIPVFEGDVVKGFYLLAYGSPDNPGEDVDGDGVGDQVIHVFHSPLGEGRELPPLEELLKDN